MEVLLYSGCQKKRTATEKMKPCQEDKMAEHFTHFTQKKWPYCLQMISATQKILSYPELAKKQANEDGNLTSIRVCMF